MLNKGQAGMQRFIAQLEAAEVIESVEMDEATKLRSIRDPNIDYSFSYKYLYTLDDEEYATELKRQKWQKLEDAVSMDEVIRWLFTKLRKEFRQANGVGVLIRSNSEKYQGEYYEGRMFEIFPKRNKFKLIGVAGPSDLK